MSDEEVKKACKQICDSRDESIFRYIFGEKVIIGAVIDVSGLGITEGAEHNMIGTNSNCANLFYRIILLNVLQIKALFGYSSERVVYEISTRLEGDKAFLDGNKAPLDFRTVTLHQPGSA